ncbi:MAG: MerC domain-containing protein [Planctomycetes bacterium]|nr:MerC domain-containing protein [Planctomycetota bacterium]
MTAEPKSGRWPESAAAALAVAVALLPRLTCPCQFPAYAGLLGSVGLAFLAADRYLFPLTAACLTLGVGGLAFQARRRWGLGPFLIGLGASVLLLTGKFLVDTPALATAGVSMLVAASVWNALPRRETAKFRFNADGSTEPASDDRDCRPT